MIVQCDCTEVRSRRYMGEEVCECSHIPHHHDFNGRCQGKRWQDDPKYGPIEGLYSGKVERMPEIIEP